MTASEQEEYILQHIDAEGEYLHRLYRATNIRLLYPRMVSGHLQGRVLKMLVRMIRPMNVLEIGTYTGYSALCMGEGLPEGAMIDTIEINDEQEDFIRQWVDGSPYADRIRLHIGDALQIVPQLARTFDLVYIDGNKRQYCDYYRMLLPRLNAGGYMVVDNTLWDGHVLEQNASSLKTTGIQAFNELVARDERVEKVILPLRDGLTIIRKK